MSTQNKNKLFLFDLDGTLINTSNLIINSLLNAIKHYSNANTKIEDLREHYKESPYQIIKKYTGYINMTNKMKTYWRIYNKAISRDAKVFPDIIKMLTTLRRKDYGIGIVTSLAKSKAKKLINTFLKFNFDVFITYNDTLNHKPNPEPINFAIEKYKRQFQLDDVSTIYIGDTEKDMLAGRNASIYTGLAAWGLKYNEFLKNRKIEQDYIFNNPLDLLSIEL